MELDEVEGREKEMWMVVKKGIKGRSGKEGI